MSFLGRLFGRKPTPLRLDFTRGHDAYWLDVCTLPSDYVRRLRAYGQRLGEIADRKASVPFVLSEPRAGAFGKRIEAFQSQIYEQVATLVGTLDSRTREALGDGYVCFVLGETSDRRRHVAVVIFGS